MGRRRQRDHHDIPRSREISRRLGAVVLHVWGGLRGGPQDLLAPNSDGQRQPDPMTGHLAAGRETAEHERRGIGIRTDWAGATATSRETVEYRGRTTAHNIPTRRSRCLSRLHLHEAAEGQGTEWSHDCFMNGHARHRSPSMGSTEPPGLRLSGYATPAEGLTIESRSRGEEKW